MRIVTRTTSEKSRNGNDIFSGKKLSLYKYRVYEAAIDPNPIFTIVLPVNNDTRRCFGFFNRSKTVLLAFSYDFKLKRAVSEAEKKAESKIRIIKSAII